VYRPLHNSYLDAWLLSRRARHGGTFTPDRGSLPQLAAALRAGGVVCMLADQRPSTQQRTSRHLFLGHQTRFSCGAEILHREAKCPVWFGALVLAKSPPPALQGEKGAGLGGTPGLPRLKLVLQRLDAPVASCNRRSDATSEGCEEASRGSSVHPYSPCSAVPAPPLQQLPSTHPAFPPVQCLGKDRSPHCGGCDDAPNTQAMAAGDSAVDDGDSFSDYAAGGGDTVMGAYAEALSRAVETYPAQYFWWHRRWKKEEECDAA
jgi:hypothetical protein